MSKSNAWETALLNHLFANAAVANVGDAGGLQPSAVAGSLYLSLHTADPGEAGTQATNETSYAGYARQAVARSGAGFTVAGNQVTLAADAVFPVGTTGAASATITHFGIGTALAGAGVLLYSGALSSPASIPVGDSVTPRLTTGTVITED